MRKGSLRETDYTRLMSVRLDARIAPNWTSAAGAIEGILAHLGEPLPRHGVMGLTGLAFHFCLGSRDRVVALPHGPSDLDRQRLADSSARTGVRWERFATRLRPAKDQGPARQAAIAWARDHLDQGRPLVGWDFHLREHAVVFGYDPERGGFLVDDLLSGQMGEFVPWTDWPGGSGEIELLAPVGVGIDDPDEALAGALDAAVEAFAGRDGPEDGQPRGTAGIDAWAEALEGSLEVDQAGNAYTLAVLQAARLDGAAFLADLAGTIPALAPSLGAAADALREETKALSPLLTLFPFPAGGHGSVSVPGLRRGAAMALRRAAKAERDAARAISLGRELLG